MLSRWEFPLFGIPVKSPTANRLKRELKILLTSFLFFLAIWATLYETSLRDSSLTQISFEIPSYFTYVKFPNPASRYAIVGIGLSVYDKIARVAVTGASHTPFRASEIESALSKNFKIDSIPLNSVSSENLNNDIHASAEYRSHLIDVLTKDAVRTYTQ